MQSKMGFPSSHQLKSYVALSPAWNLRRAVLSADAGLLACIQITCIGASVVKAVVVVYLNAKYKQTQTIFKHLGGNDY